MKRLYWADEVSNDLTVINPQSGKIIATISIDTGDRSTDGIAVSPNGRRVYITTSLNPQEQSGGPGAVVVVNAVTNQVITKIPVGNQNNIPGPLVVTPNGNRVWITNTNSNSVSVINTHTNRVIHTLPVGKNPIGISVTPDGKFIWVSNNGSNTISIFRTRTKKIVATIRIKQPGAITMAPNGKRAYVNTPNGVSIINVNTRKIIGRLPVSGIVAVSPDSKRIIVAGGTTLSSVSALTNRVMRTVTLKVPVFSMALSGNKIFLAQVQDGNFGQVTVRTLSLRFIKRVFFEFGGPLPIIAVG